MNIILASQHAAKGPGGLASYQTALERALLRDASLSVRRLALSESRTQTMPSSSSHPASASDFVGNPFINKVVAQRIVNSLSSRRSCHSALEALLHAYYFPMLSRVYCHPPSVVHFIGTGWLFFGFPLLSWARSHGALFTVWPAVHPYSWGDDAIDIRLYRQADAVFCQSQSERSHLIERGVGEDKLVVVGLPPMCRTDGDGDRFRYLHSLGQKPLVLFLGRRDEGKGYPALLRSWSRLLVDFPDAVLVLMGPGGEDYESLRRNLPSNSVIDLGIADEKTKADALAACTVFCLPSAHESFGIVYVEAWSYAKPVICGTAPACRELVQDGVTGLHTTQNPEELADKISSLLGDRDLAKRLGDHGKILQQQCFARDRFAESHLDVWSVPSRRIPES